MEMLKSLLTFMGLMVPSIASGEVVDCTGDTATTYEIVRVESRSLKVRYTFYDDSTNTLVFHGSTEGLDQARVADGKCADVDDTADFMDYQQARDAVCVGQSVAGVVPKWPENTTRDADATTDSMVRQRAFHRKILTEEWGEGTNDFDACVDPVWAYVETLGDSAFVSRWMVDGNATDFTRAQTRITRLRGIATELTAERAEKGADL